MIDVPEAGAVVDVRVLEAEESVGVVAGGAVPVVDVAGGVASVLDVAGGAAPVVDVAGGAGAGAAPPPLPSATDIY